MIFITSNEHKFHEAQEIIDENITRKNIHYPELQSESLEEVAKFGINYINRNNDVDESYFLEDAGLFIDDLGGFPGVYSSYIFETLGNEGILKLLEHNNNRKAYFKSVIAYKENQNDVRIFKGKTLGEISKLVRGNKGFGYDPIFQPKISNKTYGEMEREEKNQVSHRKKSLEKFKNFLES